jgi:beta-lactamase class A
MSYDRRQTLALGAALAAAVLLPVPSISAPEAFSALERRARGRLGVSILDTATGRAVGHRADERFPLCSTFKLLAAALVLARVDRGEEALERSVAITSAPVPYSPVTQARVGAGMSMAELCHAAVALSDNTAANLLLESFGGPAALTAYLRGLGDGVTRLDRIEPELNEALPGDPRDTTSPSAMAATMRRLLVGDALSPASRRQLAHWLLDSKTGDARLRAGVPAGWRVGDKTGSGERGTTNDVAILWPPGRPPLLVAAYLTQSDAPAAARDAILADVGRMAAAGVA